MKAAIHTSSCILQFSYMKRLINFRQPYSFSVVSMKWRSQQPFALANMVSMFLWLGQFESCIGVHRMYRFTDRSYRLMLHPVLPFPQFPHLFPSPSVTTGRSIRGHLPPLSPTILPNTLPFPPSPCSPFAFASFPRDYLFTRITERKGAFRRKTVAPE